MASIPFTELRVYRAAEDLADAVWELARRWDNFARDTIGKQIVRAADSIGANIAEGSGKGSYQDNRRYVRIARGSLCETRHWLRRAFRRKLLTEQEVERLSKLIADVGPSLNAYLKSIGQQQLKRKTDKDEPRNDDQ